MVGPPRSDPVLIGVGQRIQRDVDPRQARDPIDLMLDAARCAAEDAGLSPTALAGVDRVAVPGILGGRYSNAARLLAERLGASEAVLEYHNVGGNTPQRVVNRSARDVAAGRARMVLLAGAEAIATRRLARKAGVDLDWSGGGEAPAPASEPAPSTPAEVRHGLALPPFVYPLYENALRAHHGRDLEAQRRAVGALLSRFSETASKNPYAWFPTRREPDEITRPGPRNRMVAFPYTKYMNAVLEVDQAAAVLLTSAEHARALGVPAERQVHWLGGGDALEDPWCFSERSDFHSSPAMSRAFAEALAEARLEVSDVDGFDLYSCFPSAVQLACDHLGVGLDDERPLSLTGGLPYAGGPGNNYSTHAIATLVEWLRAGRGDVGLVSGIGWYFSKHSAGIYARAPRGELDRPEPEPRPTVPDPPARVEVAEAPSGRATIETYTVLHDRDGGPRSGVAIGRLDDGRRFLAHIDGGAEALAGFESGEGVGRTGRVAPGDEVHRLRLD